MATKIGKILLATDGSEGALRAAKFTGGLNRRSKRPIN
jgi:hypothetical protein